MAHQYRFNAIPVDGVCDVHDADYTSIVVHGIFEDGVREDDGTVDIF